MSFFQILYDIIESLFYGSSSEGTKRRELKKIDTCLREINPPIYKNGMILSAFADEMYLLFLQLNTIENILFATVLNTDTRISMKYIDFLISSGFQESEHKLYLCLFSDERKKMLIQAEDKTSEAELQKKQFDQLVKVLENSDFHTIDATIGQIERLSDMFSFDFTELFRHFDRDFVKDNPAYSPCFHSEVAVELIDVLMDFYYVINDIEINMPMARAIVILAGQLSGGVISSDEQNTLMNNIKKIAILLKKNLSSDIIKLILRVIKKDPAFQPESGKSGKKFLADFRERLKIQFVADGKRIEMELQDERLEAGIKELFGDIPLLVLDGYNIDTNHFLQSTSPYSFFWITPLQILKTFIMTYFGIPVRELLDTLLIEGFFNNQSFQSIFPSMVYRCEETINVVLAFEDSLKNAKVNDLGLLKGYIQDNRNGNSFDKKIKEMVDRINLEAKKIVQTGTKQFFDLSIKVKELIDDSKKTNPEYINNIRIIITSAKNRENFDYLENNYQMWIKFLEIMKNYAIIVST